MGNDKSCCAIAGYLIGWRSVVIVRIAGRSYGANEAVDGGAGALHTQAKPWRSRVPAARVGRRIGASTPKIALNKQMARSGHQCFTSASA